MECERPDPSENSQGVDLQTVKKTGGIFGCSLHITATIG
jgi:hypothetical protein